MKGRDHGHPDSTPHQRRPGRRRQRADLAGIQPGDVLVSWNGEEVDNAGTLRRHVGETDVGTKAKVVVIRSGMELQFEVAVAKRPKQTR